MGFLGRTKVIPADTEVRIQCSNQGAECRVALSGRVTIDSSPKVRTFLLKRMGDPKCQSLTVDFYDVPYIDASGLAILLEALKAARVQRKNFYLSGLRDRPRYLLEAAGLLHLFHEESRESSPSYHECQ
jgi:anti-anti-sigma factor